MTLHIWQNLENFTTENETWCMQILHNHFGSWEISGWNAECDKIIYTLYDYKHETALLKGWGKGADLSYFGNE